MKNRFILIFTLIASAIALGFIDDEPWKRILAQLEKVRSLYPQEKVYLHMDKPYYAIGDDIWLKAYVVNAERNEPSAISKILYVDLINEKDSVKQSLMLQLKNGLAWGNFTLADSLREGNFRIRAYTTWMRNFGDEFFFDKTISVGNAITNTVVTDVKYTFSEVNGIQQKVICDVQYSDLNGNPLAKKEVSYTVQLDFRNIAKGKGITDEKGQLKITFINTQPFVLKSGKILTNIKLNDKEFVSKSFPIKSTSNDVDVKFFPEGGDLIAGIPSKVAFKAVGSDGLSLAISGYITDKSNSKLVEFKSEHGGMGVFAFSPQQDQTYSAKVRFEDGSEKSFPLPSVQAQGYVLSVNNLDSENVKVKILISSGIPMTGDFSLIAQCNGKAYYAAKAKLDKSVFNVIIPKKRFPTGIVQFTVFSTENIPVAERLVFINHSDYLNIQVTSNKPTFAKREKVKLSVSVKDLEGKPVIGSFSLAVIDEAKVPYNEVNQSTIFSNLLLSSDIKGYIEQPNFYFTNINESTVRQLDILMLTQGWRRFNWKNLLNDAYPLLVYKPEENFAISGTVFATNGKPVVGGKVTALSTSGDIFTLDTLTDASGRFNFDNLYINDSTKFVIQARNVNGRKNVEIDLDRLPPTLVTKNKNAPEIEVNVNRKLVTYLKNSRNHYDDFERFGLRRNSIMLAEVKVIEKKPLVKNSSNLNGAGNADVVITSDKLKNCLDLAQCLESRVGGLVVQNGIAYLTRNFASSFMGPVPMQLIIDGTYVDPHFLSFVSPETIEAVEVLKSGSNTAIYGIRGGGGVLIITTKRGEHNPSFTKYAAGVANYNPKGYHKVREFYSPNYDNPTFNTKIPDLRTTIYWKPNIVTDSNGNAEVEFFNADGVGNYVTIIEGMNPDGKLGRQVFRYTVQ